MGYFFLFEIKTIAINVTQIMIVIKTEFDI